MSFNSGLDYEAMRRGLSQAVSLCGEEILLDKDRFKRVLSDTLPGINLQAERRRMAEVVDTDIGRTLLGAYPAGREGVFQSQVQVLVKSGLAPETADNVLLVFTDVLGWQIAPAAPPPPQRESASPPPPGPAPRPKPTPPPPPGPAPAPKPTPPPPPGPVPAPNPPPQQPGQPKSYAGLTAVLVIAAVVIAVIAPPLMHVCGLTPLFTDTLKLENAYVDSNGVCTVPAHIRLVALSSSGDANAEANRRKLKKVVFKGHNVIKIDSSAFRNCASLQSIVIPDSVTEIGDSAFRGCSSLQSLTVPNSVVRIGDEAFTDCSSLQSLTIPDSVKRIGEGAFTGCSSLRSVTVPKSITKIGSNAFKGVPVVYYNGPAKGSPWGAKKHVRR